VSATTRAQWYWSDWLGDQAVRRLTLAERGLWIDLLALAAVGKPTGYVCDERGKPLTHEEIARVSNAGSPVEVANLIASILEKGAASRDRTGRLFNRRMVRDSELTAKRARAGKLGGVHTDLINKSNRALAQQMSEHLLQQNKPPSRGLTPIRNNLSSENSAPRARAEAPQGSGNGEKPASPVNSPHLAQVVREKGWVA